MKRFNFTRDRGPWAVYGVFSGETKTIRHVAPRGATRLVGNAISTATGAIADASNLTLENASLVAGAFEITVSDGQAGETYEVLITSENATETFVTLFYVAVPK